MIFYWFCHHNFHFIFFAQVWRLRWYFADNKCSQFLLCRILPIKNLFAKFRRRNILCFTWPPPLTPDPSGQYIFNLLPEEHKHNILLASSHFSFKTMVRRIFFLCFYFYFLNYSLLFNTLCLRNINLKDFRCWCSFAFCRQILVFFRNSQTFTELGDDWTDDAALNNHNRAVFEEMTSWTALKMHLVMKTTF